MASSEETLEHEDLHEVYDITLQELIRVAAVKAQQDPDYVSKYDDSIGTRVSTQYSKYLVSRDPVTEAETNISLLITCCPDGRVVDGTITLQQRNNSEIAEDLLIETEYQFEWGERYRIRKIVQLDQEEDFDIDEDELVAVVVMMDDNDETEIDGSDYELTEDDHFAIWEEDSMMVEEFEAHNLMTLLMGAGAHQQSS